VNAAVTRGVTSPARSAKISVAAASAVINASCHGPPGATPITKKSTNTQSSSRP
jgi:hypothetical protein